MNVQKLYAVITGDIVKSGLLMSQRDRTLRYLKKTLRSAEAFKKGEKEIITFSSIFRGDSFQGVISDFAQALRVAMFIRAELLKLRINKGKTEVRIAIGIGTIESLNRRKIEESDGEAFRLSGQALDTIKSFRRFSFESSRDEMCRPLRVMASLLDALIFRWTAEQAEVVSLWLKGETQESISKILGISQPAVQQRLKTAGLFALEDAIGFFHSLAGEYKV